MRKRVHAVIYLSVKEPFCLELCIQREHLDVQGSACSCLVSIQLHAPRYYNDELLPPYIDIFRAFVMAH